MSGAIIENVEPVVDNTAGVWDCEVEKGPAPRSELVGARGNAKALELLDEEFGDIAAEEDPLEGLSGLVAELVLLEELDGTVEDRVSTMKVPET